MIGLSGIILKRDLNSFYGKYMEFFFIAWIGNFILSSIMGILGGSNAEILSRIVGVIIIIGLNPLPETLYQKYLSRVKA